jgi:L-ascorbate metabolism protein UlaG (beta-lactamase superfamily)
MQKQEKFYLRQNIQVEPLVDRWYAWPHLIPPATAARNLTERHLKIMDSYINSPGLHAKAVKNPKMLGGPFIDDPDHRVDGIRELRDRTKTERSDLIELSSAISALDKMLKEKAKGHSLQTLYAEVPKALKGYVELVYDLANQPSFRLIEPLLYRSKYYDPSLQSLMFQVISKDDRPFILSTPRLDSDEMLHLQLPFHHPGIDNLFRLKTRSQSWPEIKEMLEIKDADDALMQTFLTFEPPPRYPAYTGPGLRWRYFGHACVLVETEEFTALIDPALSYTYESTISRFTYLDLPEFIDYVLITHNHQDHILFETLLQLRHKIGQIIVPRNGNGSLQDPSLKLLLNNCGFDNVVELTEMEELRYRDVRITGLPFIGEHADLAISTKMGWLLRIGTRSLLFVADSCNIEPLMYEHIHRETGDVDVIFLGMECDGAPLSWLYGPLLARTLDRSIDESRRLSGSNCEQGMRLVEAFNCKEVYVYAMGQEPWLNYIMSIKYNAESRPIVESNRLIATCREHGIIAERLFGEKEILLDSSHVQI